MLTGKFAVSHDAALVDSKAVQDCGSEPPCERAETGLAQHIPAIYLDGIRPRGLFFDYLDASPRDLRYVSSPRVTMTHDINIPATRAHTDKARLKARRTHRGCAAAEGTRGGHKAFVPWRPAPQRAAVRLSTAALAAFTAPGDSRSASG